MKILTLLAILVALIVAWFTSHQFDNFIQSNVLLLTLLGGISIIAVFIQIYQSDKQLIIERNKDREKAHARLISRITALSSEIICNIQFCNVYANEREQYLAEPVTAPSVKFRTETAIDLIKNGEIGHHQLRAKLFSLIEQMNIINTIIDVNLQRMYLRQLLPEGRIALFNQATIQTNTFILNKVQKIRAELASTQPQIEEYLNNPDKFLDEKYLRGRLIPDAVLK